MKWSSGLGFGQSMLIIGGCSYTQGSIGSFHALNLEGTALCAAQHHVALCSQGTVQQMGGSIIPHDSYASTLPPLLDGLLVIILRQSFLSSLLALLLHIQPYTFPCSSEAVSATALRCTSAAPPAAAGSHLNERAALLCTGGAWGWPRNVNQVFGSRAGGAGGWCWDLQSAHLRCVFLSLQFSGANQLRDSITDLYPTGVSDFD